MVPLAWPQAFGPAAVCFSISVEAPAAAPAVQSTTCHDHAHFHAPTPAHAHAPFQFAPLWNSPTLLHQRFKTCIVWQQATKLSLSKAPKYEGEKSQKQKRKEAGIELS